MFARSEGERAFSQELGADWAGDHDETAPEKLDCIIDTTPVWRPVLGALRNLAPGGRLVINAIGKEEQDKAAAELRSGNRRPAERVKQSMNEAPICNPALLQAAVDAMS